MGTLLQWCKECQAATPTYICPGCHTDRCASREPRYEGYCTVACVEQYD